MKDPVIQARDFRKTYGNLVAVDGISFDVREGKIFGLLGPNGSGKTSTVETTCADLLLGDWELPGLRTTNLLPASRARRPQLKVNALGGRPEARRVALAAGADAFVSKREPPERFLAAVGDLWGGRETKVKLRIRRKSDDVQSSSS